MIPSVLISAPTSSAGKTTLTCAFASFLKKNGHSPAVLKVGPDYIDPLFHSEISESLTGNLDLFFTPPQTVKNIFLRDTKDADFAIVEGAMGLFDGEGGSSVRASAFDVASVLGLPIVLVVDAAKKSLSLCAEIFGIIKFAEEESVKNQLSLPQKKSPIIAGVILNRASKTTYELLAPQIKKLCGLEVFGYLEDNPDFFVGSRHLGLVTPSDVEGIKEKILNLASSAEKTIDFKRIIDFAKKNTESSEDFCAPSFCSVFESENSPACKVVRIAVPRDRAFCFYYRENLSLLESFGAELCYFSPLKNEPLPKNCSGLYIGGGYPELFPAELSENKISANSVRAFCRSGAPVFAECGGFLYLQLLGLLPGSFENKNHLVRFGYVELVCNEDNFLLKKGEKIRGHEFHYFDTTQNGAAFTAKKVNGKTWECIQVASPLQVMRPSCCQRGDKALRKKYRGGLSAIFILRQTRKSLRILWTRLSFLNPSKIQILQILPVILVEIAQIVRIARIAKAAQAKENAIVRAVRQNISVI
ncbi:cobyrinate a,c-diamide synthase [Treponema zioleckii]|uniref:cobyrinate a,c-diamide synthase n=1 Tax=Treponema zioleckii TaxID=331680 RepID=UPI00168C090B